MEWLVGHEGEEAHELMTRMVICLKFRQRDDLAGLLYGGICFHRC